MQIETSLQRSFWFSWLHEVSGVHDYMLSNMPTDHYYGYVSPVWAIYLDHTHKTFSEQRRSKIASNV